MNGFFTRAALAFATLAAVNSFAKADEVRAPYAAVYMTQKGEKMFFSVPRDFDAQKPITIVVYCHGLLTDETFEEVLARQRVAEQVEAAVVNAVLVAPSLAARPKKRAALFAKRDSFKKFLKEATAAMAKATRVSPSVFVHARVVIVAYSGGHLPVKMAIARGGIALDGVVLLDAHYGSQKIFAEQAIRFSRQRSGFFVSSYMYASSERGKEFEKMLEKAGVPFTWHFQDGRLSPGSVVVKKIEASGLHYDFVTEAWTQNPITDVLKKAYGQ